MGNAYQDDESIGDDSALWRRIRPDWAIYDENLGRRRPTSQAFQNRGDGMSVLLGAEVESPEVAVESVPGYGLVSFTAGLVRQLDQLVARDPTPEEAAHALVVGNKTGPVKRTLAESALWLIEPD
jgi:hypothetical protein